MMEKLDKAGYAGALGYIDEKAPGAVYALSAALGIQPGDIFAFPRCVLIWHRSGFAFICGEYDDDVLAEIYDTFYRGPDTGRRFVLFARDERVTRFFADKRGVSTARRLFFEYPEGRQPDVTLPPDGLRVREIDARLFDTIEGRITPFFSWDDRESFLERGKGYCVADGERAVAWAFSAAISDGEIDIGVETAEHYRRMGLAAIAAGEMIRYTLRQGKRPVWSCLESNAASRGLAGKLGFVNTAECQIIRKAPAAGRDDTNNYTKGKEQA